jgi:hypothetical protein
MKKPNGNLNSFVSLKEYVDQKQEDLEEKIDLHFKLVELATKKAEDKLDLRLEGMNEFRNALKDQSATFITRCEFDALIKKYEEKTEYVTKWVNVGIGIAVVISFIMKFVKF